MVSAGVAKVATAISKVVAKFCSWVGRIFGGLAGEIVGFLIGAFSGWTIGYNTAKALICKKGIEVTWEGIGVK